MLKVWLELPLISCCISSKGAVLFLLSGLGEPEGPRLKTQKRTENGNYNIQTSRGKNWTRKPQLLVNKTEKEKKEA